MSAEDQRRSARRGFWVAALIFLIGMAFTTAPTPLYPIYEEREGYRPTLIATVFAVYPVGVMIGVLLLGHVSDWIGRRRALLPALGIEALTAAAFALSPSLWVLLPARLICGVGVGVLTATGAAWLSDLDARARGGRPRRTDMVATMASAGGFGFGVLVSGALAAMGRAPLRLPYLVFGVLLLAAIGAAARVPETVPALRAGTPFRRQRVVVPADARATFFAACAGGFAAFSLLSLFTSLAPTFIVTSLGVTSPAVTGAVVASCCFSAGLGQIALLRLPAPALLHTALVLLPAGMGLVLVAVVVSSLWLFLAAGVVGGVGSGALFRRSLGTVDEAAPSEARAEAFAGFYLAVYLNATVPVLGLGLITQTVGVVPAVAIFATTVISVLGVVAAPLHNAAQRAR